MSDSHPIVAAILADRARAISNDPAKEAVMELRALVTKRIESGSRVLVVPVLLSFGGIEQGVRKRLEGLDYTMAPQAIMPDDRLADWIEAQVAR